MARFDSQHGISMQVALQQALTCTIPNLELEISRYAAAGRSQPAAPPPQRSAQPSSPLQVFGSGLGPQRPSNSRWRSTHHTEPPPEHHEAAHAVPHSQLPEQNPAALPRYHIQPWQQQQQRPRQWLTEQRRPESQAASHHHRRSSVEQQRDSSRHGWQWGGSSEQIAEPCAVQQAPPVTESHDARTNASAAVHAQPGATAAPALALPPCAPAADEWQPQPDLRVSSDSIPRLGSPPPILPTGGEAIQSPPAVRSPSRRLKDLLPSWLRASSTVAHSAADNALDPSAQRSVDGSAATTAQQKVSVQDGEAEAHAVSTALGHVRSPASHSVLLSCSESDCSSTGSIQAEGNAPGISPVAHAAPAAMSLREARDPAPTTTEAGQAHVSTANLLAADALGRIRRSLGGEPGAPSPSAWARETQPAQAAHQPLNDRFQGLSLQELAQMQADVRCAEVTVALDHARKRHQPAAAAAARKSFHHSASPAQTSQPARAPSQARDSGLLRHSASTTGALQLPLQRAAQESHPSYPAPTQAIRPAPALTASPPAQVPSSTPPPMSMPRKSMHGPTTPAAATPAFQIHAVGSQLALTPSTLAALATPPSTRTGEIGPLRHYFPAATMIVTCAESICMHMCICQCHLPWSRRCKSTCCHLLRPNAYPFVTKIGMPCRAPSLCGPAGC